MEPKLGEALWAIALAVTLLAALVTLGLLWKGRILTFRLRKGALVGIYAVLGLYWLVEGGVRLAERSMGPRVAIPFLLGLLWVGLAAHVFRHPEHYRLQNS
jgi:hypothetical protein